MIGEKIKPNLVPYGVNLGHWGGCKSLFKRVIRPVPEFQRFGYHVQSDARLASPGSGMASDCLFGNELDQFADDQSLYAATLSLMTKRKKAM